MRKLVQPTRTSRSLASHRLAHVIGGTPNVDTHEITKIELTFDKIEHSITDKK